VEGKLYGGQDLLSGGNLLRTGVLHPLPNPNGKLEISPPESLVRLYYVRDSLSGSPLSDWFPVESDEPKTPVQQMSTLSVLSTISPPKRLCDGPDSPSKKQKGEDREEMVRED
jgi:hypothetical protein